MCYNLRLVVYNGCQCKGLAIVSKTIKSIVEAIPGRQNVDQLIVAKQLNIIRGFFKRNPAIFSRYKMRVCDLVCGLCVCKVHLQILL